MLRYVKQLPMTPRVHLLIYLIEGCLKRGEIKDVSFLCKYTTPSWYNIRKSRRMKLFHFSYGNWRCRWTSNMDEDW
jgi:hypothetical protein